MLDTTFLDALASKDPTPGGGGAAAYAGALASALASMVGNLTVGKKSYAQVEGEVRASVERLADVRQRLLELVDADARAFEPLAASYRMPKDTIEQAALRDQAIQEALVGACEVPLDIMRSCMDVIRECNLMAHKGCRSAVSDAGAAVALARSALYAASLNVYININSMENKDRADSYRRKADELIEEGATQADEVYTFVCDQIDALY